MEFLKQLVELTAASEDDTRVKTLARQLDKLKVPFLFIFVPLNLMIPIVRLVSTFFFDDLEEMYPLKVLSCFAIAHVSMGISPTLGSRFRRHADICLCFALVCLCWSAFLAVHSMKDKGQAVQLHQGACLLAHVAFGGTFQIRIRPFVVWVVNLMVAFVFVRLKYIRDFGVSGDLPETFQVMSITCSLLFGLRFVRDAAFSAAVEHETARKTAEQEKTSFLSYIMHEVRNPLGAACLMMSEEQEVIVDLRKVLEAVPSDDQNTHRVPDAPSPSSSGKSKLNNPKISALLASLEEIAKAVQAQIDQMGSICNDVLHLEKLASGAFQFDFSARCIAEFFQDIAAETFPVMKSAGLKFHPQLWVDPSLRLSKSRRLCGIADFTRLRQFSVLDEGQGVDPQEGVKLFKPYSQIRAGEQQKGGGTGLGLCISRVFVEAHCGGKIGFFSQGSGCGSEFFFHFEGPLVTEDLKGNVSLMRHSDGNVSLTGLDRPPSGGGNAEEKGRTERREEAAEVCEESSEEDEDDETETERTFSDLQESTQGLRSVTALTEVDKSDMAGKAVISDGHENTVMTASPDSRSGIRRRRRSGANASPRRSSAPTIPPPTLNDSLTQNAADKAENPVADVNASQLSDNLSHRRQRSLSLSFYDADALSSAVKEWNIKAMKRWTADVLIVDDNSMVQIAVSFALKRMGLSVEVAEDGAAAVARFKEAGERYRLVFMDRNMPYLEGPEAIASIRALLTETASPLPTFIGLTGQTEGSEDFIRAGAVEILFKPVTPKVLRTTLEKLGFLLID
uniref:histidine kinase n=1 Tax=Chromera velia CCMP2878 TaxID=1169474 RepID=A0A0G4I656_9ALVE|eukprot:Cvel_11301.t1-p1 / transcript=Cvel_11301.t1 / gene=Cvel_11301 / organism=Chromera_velia_CCMP2878 / gene_product=hypothetical protein / transcript_product=hypothetical protein / location=Cvel_scaffold706:45454-50352(-) / protein_length=789 / sequence_SO=supercontig / SO=protein_coding / is_pseudo=false